MSENGDYLKRVLLANKIFCRVLECVVSEQSPWAIVGGEHICDRGMGVLV